MVTDLLRHPDLGSFDLSALRVAMGGGATVSRTWSRTSERALGVQLIIGYGQSESPAACKPPTLSMTSRRTGAAARTPLSPREMKIGRCGHWAQLAALGAGELLIRPL